MIAAVEPAGVPSPGKLLRDGMFLIHRDPVLRRRLMDLSREGRALARERAELARHREAGRARWWALRQEIDGLNAECDHLGRLVEEMLWRRYEADTQETRAA